VLELQEIVNDVGDALVALDSCGVPFKQFQQGVGPYGEPQLMRAVVDYLRKLSRYDNAQTKRTPDVLIPGKWALEFKIARPYGDNGKQAENWSVNLLHPYEGNVSLIGDCLKLARLHGPERRAAVVIGYEHTPPEIALAPLLLAFEVIAKQVMTIDLGSRKQTDRSGLRHPIHQQLVVAAWEVLSRNVGNEL
jgi:hypothetical protein